MKLDIPLTELTPASISRLLTLRECKVTEDTLTLTIDDTSAQDADHKGIVLMDLPEEDLLATVHPLVTDTKLLTRYNLYKVEVHYHEDRLTISAVCHEDRPFTLHYNKPPICKVKGRLGKLATMELLRLNKCRIIFNDFDEHSMLHLREAINVLIKDSRGLVSNIEVHFQKSECEIDVDALVMWFCIYRDLSPYLSSHVTFEKKHNARYVFTSMDKRHDQSEHDLFRSLARKGKRLYNKFSPFHETRQFSFQTQSWSMLIWNTVAVTPVEFEVGEKMEELIKWHYPFPDDLRMECGPKQAGDHAGGGFESVEFPGTYRSDPEYASDEDVGLSRSDDPDASEGDDDDENN